MLNQEEIGLLIDQLSEVIEEREIGYKRASEKINDPYLKEGSKILADMISMVG